MVHEEHPRSAVVDEMSKAAAELLALGRVEPRGRLVEQQDPGARSDRPRHAHQLLPAVGQGRGVAVGHVVEVERGQGRVDRRGVTVAAGPDQVGEETQRAGGHRCHLTVLADGEVLEQFHRLPRAHHPGTGPPVRRQVGQVDTVEQDTAAVRDESRQGVDGGGLARPVRSDQAHELTRPDHQVDLGDREHAAVGDRHALGPEARVGITRLGRAHAGHPSEGPGAGAVRAGQDRLATPQTAATAPSRMSTTARAAGGRPPPSLGGRTRASTLPTTMAAPNASTMSGKKLGPRNSCPSPSAASTGAIAVTGVTTVDVTTDTDGRAGYHGE